MEASKRRAQIVARLKENDGPCSASMLAKEFHVSRQIVVGDVALLRAQGHQIIATPRGYVCEHQGSEGILATIAVTHTNEQLAKEIYTIVDMGGALLDVIVEHPLYGQLCGNLHIYSRYDADQFFAKMESAKAAPLSQLTNGLHLHTIQCKDEDVLKRIQEALRQEGILYDKDN